MSQVLGLDTRGRACSTAPCAFGFDHSAQWPPRTTNPADRLLVMHDRRRPRTTANIAHIAVTPSGVWVIDTKRYKGLVTKVDKGGWLRADHRLMVGSRDRTALIDGVHKQIHDVEAALARAGLTDVPVPGALCFIDSEFRLLARPFDIGGVLVTWPKKLREALLADGPLDAAARASIHRHLVAALPPVAPDTTGCWESMNLRRL